MTDTTDEIKQQVEHERKMHSDLEYAFRHISDSVFSSPDELEQFIDDHQLFPVILRDLFVALKEAKQANTQVISMMPRRAGKSSMMTHAVQHIYLSRSAVISALGRVRSVIDSKIEDVAGGVR